MGTSNYQSKKKFGTGLDLAGIFLDYLSTQGYWYLWVLLLDVIFLFVRVLRYWGLGFSCFIRPYYTGR